MGVTQRQAKEIGTVNITEDMDRTDSPAVSSINVSVSSLKPNTPVSVTVNGVTSVTTAGVIAGIDPTVQISVPHVPAIIKHAGNGGKSKGSHGSMHGGSDNAHDHATVSHTGAGGGFHY